MRLSSLCDLESSERRCARLCGSICLHRLLCGCGYVPITNAWRNMCVMMGAWTARGYSVFSVIEKESGRWIGRLGPWRPEGWPGTEVMYGLAREVWGKGYASEGVAAAIDWAFSTLDWTAVIHCIDPLNDKSQRVATRLGSKLLRKARLPAPLNVEVDIWGQALDEWLMTTRSRSQGH